MTSKLDIFNLALIKVGSRTTMSSVEEDGDVGDTLRAAYEQALTSTLQMSWWNFAQRFEYGEVYAVSPLAPTSTTSSAQTWKRTDPPPPWLYAYLKPADCIQVRAIIIQQNGRFVGPLKFRTATMFDAAQSTYVPVIVTDAPLAINVYTADVRDPSLFDGQMVDAVASRLAKDTALSITGDLKIWQKCESEWQKLLSAAQVSDANEGLGFIDFLPESLATRGLDTYGDAGNFTNLRGTV